MKEYGVFDLIGPQMIGPSSSHTAGAARLGGVAYRLAGGKIKNARVTLYGSFADTGRGHGTDKAIVAGLLGLAPDDSRLRNSLELAAEQKKDITVEFSSQSMNHPNTARIIVEDENGRRIDCLRPEARRQWQQALWRNCAVRMSRWYWMRQQSH